MLGLGDRDHLLRVQMPDASRDLIAGRYHSLLDLSQLLVALLEQTASLSHDLLFVARRLLEKRVVVGEPLIHQVLSDGAAGTPQRLRDGSLIVHVLDRARRGQRAVHVALNDVSRRASALQNADSCLLRRRAHPGALGSRTGDRLAPLPRAVLAETHDRGLCISTCERGLRRGDSGHRRACCRERVARDVTSAIEVREQRRVLRRSNGKDLRRLRRRLRQRLLLCSLVEPVDLPVFDRERRIDVRRLATNRDRCESIWPMRWRVDRGNRWHRDRRRCRRFGCGHARSGKLRDRRGRYRDQRAVRCGGRAFRRGSGLGCYGCWCCACGRSDRTARCCRLRFRFWTFTLGRIRALVRSGRGGFTRRSCLPRSLCERGAPWIPAGTRIARSR